jgi:hypothetical protein
LDRDAQGYPEGIHGGDRRPVNFTNINGGGTPVNAEVDNSNSGNVNHHLPWLVGLGIGVGAALFGVIVIMWKGPQYMEAVAEAKSADATALAQLARKEASTAKDFVDVEKAKTRAYEELKEEFKNGRR